ncbi:MAG: FAD-dependent thymidylate synthase [Alphaproteobacteria bacterium]|jgi:thymidylate synthase (FAD)
MVINKEQKEQYLEQRKESHTTLRPTVKEMEDILYLPFEVLDHGFIRVVDYMGDDSAIVQAARVSYGKGTKKLNEDRGLINYLIKHWHTTPFEMCEIKLHVKLPIFVARQWIRHRTANVNEYSARYSVMDREFYIPSVELLAPQSKKNHQGRSEEALTKAEAKEVLEILKNDAEQCYNNYEKLMNKNEKGEPIDESKKGIARELARMNLTLNTYTQFYWKIDLHNFMHFVFLRNDAHAQYEIRVYGEILQDIMKKWVPLTYQAFIDYRQNAVSFSGKEIALVKQLIKGEKISFETSNLSKREWEEFEGKI